MPHTTLVPQPLEKSKKKPAHNTISINFGTTPGSTKCSSTTSKASPTSAPGQLTAQDVINASLRKSTSQKYLSYQRLWKEYCAEKNKIYGSPTVEQFHLEQNFFTELSILVPAKTTIVHVLRMKYQHIPQHPSIIKYFKGSFNLGRRCQNFFFVWDVQIMFDFFRNLGDNSQILDKNLSQKLLILLLLLGGQRLNILFYNWQNNHI